MSKIIALYHIVFCTKYREYTIPSEHKEDLYRFIWKEIENHDSYLIRIGGIENHLHILLDLHAKENLSNLVQDIKSKTSGWLRQDNRFRFFRGWASGYFASTVSPDNKNSVIEYIKSQPEHHAVTNFDKELITLYKAAGIDYHEKDMME